MIDTKGLDIKVGTVAEFDPEFLTGKSAALRGKPVRITKVNPKSLKVETEDGSVITTDAFMLIPTDKPFKRQEGPKLTLGSLVRFQGELHVVVKTDLTRYNIARLGGQDGRYYRGIPGERLEHVDPATVLA